MAPPDRERRALVAAAALVVATAAAFFWSYHGYGLAVFDEGVLLEGIRSSARGEMDFARFTHYSAMYGLLARLFPSGEPDLEVVRLIWVALRSLTALLVLLSARKLVPLAWSLLPVACFLALPGPWHKAVVGLSVALCLHAALRALERNRRRDHCWLAATIAFAIAMHVYTGLLTLAGWAVVALLLPRAAVGRGRPALERHLAFAATLIAATLLLADFVRQTPWPRLVGQNLGLVGSVAPGSRMFAGQLLAAATTPRAALQLSLYAAVLPAMAAALWLARRHRLTHPGAFAAVACTVALGLANLPKWLVRLDLAHLLQNGTPFWMLLAFLLHHVWDRATVVRAGRPRWHRTLALGLAAAASLWLAAVLAYGLTSTETFVGGIGTRWRVATVPLAHRGGVLQVEPGVARTLNALERLVDDATAPGEPILVCGSPRILHYLTGRWSPFQIPAFTLPAAYLTTPEALLVDELRSSGTRLVVYDDTSVIPLEEYRVERLAPRLHRVLMTEFELVAEVDGLQVRRRRAAA